ncbi:MAG: flagellar motor switch protein FliN [Alphaproteobacteria bacterium]|nr:flagellar motor switch protein FliN [Alphaproteobacteria bacterium]
MTHQSQIHAVKVEVSVILGRCVLPMHQLLKMGRGAVIPLDTGESDSLWILAAGHPIAKGDISVDEERLCVTVTEAADVNEYNAVE